VDASVRELLARGLDRPFQHLEEVDETTPLIAAVETGMAAVMLEPRKEWTIAHWSAESAKDLVDCLHRAAIASGTRTLHVRLEFVPPLFEAPLAERGLVTTSEWRDMWLADISSATVPRVEGVSVREAQRKELPLAVNVTATCRYASRDFTGESLESLTEWLIQDEVTMMTDTGTVVSPHKEHTVQPVVTLAVDAGENPVGMSMWSVYGWDSAKGPVFWLRELAVRPDCRNRGVGRAVIGAGLAWGKEQGATRSFLAVDAENAVGIHLYESVGYRLKPERGQINMCCSLAISSGDATISPWVPGNDWDPTEQDC
jgi:ribosomal protein S18 acetylase RimI-like enzyme